MTTPQPDFAPLIQAIYTKALLLAPFLFGLFILYLCGKVVGRRFFAHTRRPYGKYKSSWTNGYKKAWEAPAVPRILSEEERLANDLAAVNNLEVVIAPKAILTPKEAQVFYAARDLIREPAFAGWLVFAQASLGELFSTGPEQDSAARAAYCAFNGRRSDLVITDKYGMPILMVEYQGKQHHQGKYYMRDEIKRRVFQRANVRCLELPNTLTPEEIKSRLREQFAAIAAERQKETQMS